MDLFNLHLISGPSCDQSLVPDTTTFPVHFFLSLLQTKPLEAKALLEAGVAQGTVVFPCGTNDLEYDSTFRLSLQLHDELGPELGPDVLLCQQCYGAEPAKPVRELETFPYAYTLGLLDRLAAGTPPLFYHWAVLFLKELYHPGDDDWGQNHLVDYPTPD
jgi:hypothetical protein